MIFKYKAYDNLLADLGRNDYVVEISELAIRDFMQNIKDATSKEDFIKSKCIQHQIMLSFDKSNSYYNQITLGHIANIYHLAESFFYDLQTEYNDLGNWNWKFETGKPKLTQLINFFNQKNRFNNRDKIEPYLIDTFEYYHQLRVYFSHKKTTSLNEVENKWKKAESHFNEELLLKYRVKSGPKKIADLDFEDFFLFTQITKDLALRMSSICYPESEGLASLTEIKVLKKHKDIETQKLRIESFLKTKYGFIKENDSDILIDEIIKHL